jgi:hypothetical protein
MFNIVASTLKIASNKALLFTGLSFGEARSILNDPKLVGWHTVWLKREE